MDDKAMIEALYGLLGVLCAIAGWGYNRIIGKLDKLAIHREDCIRMFADKDDNTEDHRRIWATVDEYGKVLAAHGVDIVNLKGRDGEKGWGR